MPSAPPRLLGSTGRRRRTNRRELLALLAGAAAMPWPRAAAAQTADAQAQPVIEQLDMGRATLELQFAPVFDARFRADARVWVQRSAAAVVAYFGRFPVPRAALLIAPEGGAGVRGGTTWGLPSLLMRLRVGPATTPTQFLDDWVLVHEMIHLAVPRVPRPQSWLHEGIATYVESVARGRAGLVAPATVWREWSRAMPQGLPAAGDAGLDHTPTWGRTYWGGAIFCLMADVQLLTRTTRRAGLQQALQGVLAAGGNYAVAWPADRILATADAAVGETVLTALYERMKAAPAPPDLDALWRELGVGRGGLDDAAPLAAVRRAILS